MDFKKYKAILFDMDGVITNTDTFHFEVWSDILADYNITLTRPLYEKHLQSRSHIEGLSSLLPDCSKAELDNISSRKDQVSKERIVGAVDVYEDTKELIKKLAQKDIILAVVSASNSASFVIKEIDFEQYFSLIVSGTSGTSLKNKPAPDIYLHTMNLLHVSPSQTLVIEDSVSGITAGLKSGADVIGIRRNPLMIDQHERLTVIDDLRTLITKG